MKFSLAAIAVCLALSLANAAEPITKTDLPPSPQAAIEAVTKTTLPAGVTLTGASQIIAPPSTKKEDATKDAIASDSDSTSASAVASHEQFLGGWGGLGWGGWGSWGGWGGFGPYRFGYSCGGLGGWAYPLGYWNAFGAGLFGGGCGLGLAYGGLFYC